MTFWVTVLCALLACLLGGLYLAGAFRKRRPKEPPLDKGTIPWLGHGLTFRSNTANFLKMMQKKYGDIFTVLIGGQYFTFLMDPLSFGAVVKEARAKLDFNDYASELVVKVFGFRACGANHKILEASSTRHLKGNGLGVMTEAMMESLRTVMLHDLGTAEGQRQWKQDGLFHFSYNLVFRAGYLALYGNEPNTMKQDKEEAKRSDLAFSEEVYEEFRKYDKLFPRLAFSMLTYGEKRKVERLKRLFWNILSVKEVYQKDNISGWISDQNRQLAEAGMPEYMRDRYMFLLLWAAQGNTGPASFWLLLHLMKNPKAMEEVRKEVDGVIRKSGQEVKPGGEAVKITKEMLSETPVMDSALEETLRMAAAPLLIRVVKEDMELNMNGGRVYSLRKGDKLGIFPYTAVHMDPDIHPQPHVFKYDRFLSLDGTKKEFFKNGEKVKYYTMPWGAGVSMCPGRFFAGNEMKLFVFLCLAYFDMELVNKDEEVPPIDESRYGFGVMQPTHDIQLRYRLRF
ncbi:7-alpha-hydroxycholest-4-en-3-one 12-alpha-hydroxylase-like [Hemicordylus capensis]|uniref:7-alpha-hydroxycholest-4-en-3-one 12-alpha-hydroxylase-like n=1 Tax=Hemicordylus capensis TaxID=884348 RepID=UPI0023038B4D|nr:7-alpha-hydroxycholest-4-en-3-one 12-alpha-hydroxylase-like [Hemicordylus capensis]